MIHQLVYENTLGERVEFGGETGKWHFGDTDIFSIKLEYSKVGDTITSFKKGIREFTLNVMLRGGGVEERNRIVDVLSYDTHVASHGTLFAGGSYMRCYAMELDPSSWHFWDGYMNLEVRFVTDEPHWVREVRATLTAQTAQAVGGLNYPHDYPHNFLMPATTASSIVNPFQLPAKCDIVFAGPCVNPYVIIGGNRYQVDATAEEGQVVIVRGFGAKGIVVKDADGSEMNVFAKGVRAEGARVFAEVPVGENVVNWPGGYNIEVIMYEERLTPWWI